MKRKFVLILAALMILVAIPAAADTSGFLEPCKTALWQYGRLGLIFTEDALWDYEEWEMMSTVAWDMLTPDEVTAQTHPDLAAALEEINRKRAEECEALSGELGELAREMLADTGESGLCTADFNIYLQRADQAVLSYRSDSEIFGGGIHADYGTAGVNLDPDTGRELALSDVAADRDALLALLAEKLEEKYPGELADSGFGEQLLTIPDDELEWTLGYEGITFFFNPYVILNYASGRAAATIRYDEAEDLFVPEYVPADTGAYAVRIPLCEEIEFGERKDGTSCTLQPLAWKGEWDAYEQIDLVVDGKSNPQEMYAYSMEIYMVTAGENGARKNYLYMETVQENDYTTLHIFDLNGETPVKVCELFGTGFAGGLYTGKGVLNDLNNVALDTHMEMIGTRFGSRAYSIDADTGLLIPKQEYYDIYTYGYPLTSLIPLTVTMLDTGEEETVPAGTEFTELRTDGETYMDFRLNDGRECRIEVDTTDYPHLINGVDECECFEGIVYAG